MCIRDRIIIDPDKAKGNNAEDNGNGKNLFNPFAFSDDKIGKTVDRMFFLFQLQSPPVTNCGNHLAFWNESEILDEKSDIAHDTG